MAIEITSQLIDTTRYFDVLILINKNKKAKKKSPNEMLSVDKKFEII